MADQKNQPAKEVKRREKRIEEEAAQLVREQARRQTDLAREQAIQKSKQQKRPSVKRNALRKNLHS